MKLNRSYLFIAISSIALVIVLVIQVNWILKTAQVKEQLFNEKANMVLSRTMEALTADKEAIAKIGSCMPADTAPARLENREVNKIDSLFNHYMKLYNFRIDYAFEVARPNAALALSEVRLTEGVYCNSVEDAAGLGGFQLKLIFPEKRQYILAEMGPMFITSVILIVVVLLLFWRTLLSLMKEKKISEHTTDFLNNMTHEFKTPLTNIALAGKMMGKEAVIKQEDKVRHYTEIILEENEKLRLQVEQVLSMTALERGEIPLQKAVLDMHELIRESVKCISVQVENAQGSVAVKAEATNAAVPGDKTHLTNALANLVDNAIKYANGKPEITIRTFDAGQNLVIEVSDKGIGIEKEYQRKVFDKFFRVPTGNVHDVKGFGLGLAYVKKIVELHGGSIELHSEKGKGATFIVTLPHA